MHPFLQKKEFQARGLLRLGSGTVSFADAVDEAVLLPHDLKVLLGRDVPLKALTHRSSLFSIIIRLSTPTERRHILDPQVAMEAFHNRDIAEIGWKEREMNITEEFTKPLQCEAMMVFLRSHRLEYYTLQWVLRVQTRRYVNLTRWRQLNLPPPPKRSKIHAQPLRRRTFSQ